MRLQLIVVAMLALCLQANTLKILTLDNSLQKAMKLIIFLQIHCVTTFYIISYFTRLFNMATVQFIFLG